MYIFASYLNLVLVQSNFSKVFPSWLSYFLEIFIAASSCCKVSGVLEPLFFHRLIGLKSEVYWLSSEIAVLTLRVWLTMAIFFPLHSYNSLLKTQILGQFRSRRFVGASWKFGAYARDSKIDHSWSKRKVFYLFFSPQHNTTNSTPH